MNGNSKSVGDFVRVESRLSDFLKELNKITRSFAVHHDLFTHQDIYWKYAIKNLPPGWVFFIEGKAQIFQIYYKIYKHVSLFFFFPNIVHRF